MLQREPEELVTATFQSPPFSADLEEMLAQTLGQFVRSEEFAARSKQDRSPADTWVQMLIRGKLPLWIDLGDRGVSRSCLVEYYEPDETRFLLGALKPGMRFLDVGANIGWFAVQGADAIGPEGQLIAFEPRPSTFQWLARSIAANGFADRAELHNVATGAAAGEMMIGWAAGTDNPGGTWSVASVEVERMMRESGSVMTTVPVKTIDEVVGDRRIDVVKIDIEGAEPFALRGATRMLATSRPLILSEINPEAIRLVSGTSPADYVETVTAFGYRCRVLTADGPGAAFDAATLGAVDMVNVVFEPI